MQELMAKNGHAGRRQRCRKFEDLIAYMSRAETLYPGDFIGSGTCSVSLGKGCGLEMNRFLKPDDTVELEVEKLGILQNRIVADTMEKNVNLKKRGLV